MRGSVERKMAGLKSPTEIREIYLNDFKPAYESGDLEKASEISVSNPRLPLSDDERKEMHNYYCRKYGASK